VKRSSRFFKIAVASLLLIFGASHADQKKSSSEYLAEIQKYLNDMTTFESDFIQIDKYGGGSFGHFLLKRPFLMKMDYTDPATRAIIAKDDKILCYDKELKEKTITSMHSYPLSFLLERRINLLKNLEVLSIQSGDDFLSVKLARKSKDAEGAITLIFSKNPLTLRKWIVFSDRNDESPSRSVEISLVNWKSRHPISDKEFEL
jgi:outer membrane lipoprotein-sorting protein